MSWVGEKWDEGVEAVKDDPWNVVLPYAMWNAQYQASGQEGNLSDVASPPELEPLPDFVLDDDPAIAAAQLEARSQQEALDYLKEREAIPQEVRESALKELSGIYGLGGFGAPKFESRSGPLQQIQFRPGDYAFKIPAGTQFADGPAALPGENVTRSVPVFAGLGMALPGLSESKTTGEQKSYDDFGLKFDQGEAVERAIGSPLYQAMMGGRGVGEEAILRSAAATGGLRSGNVQEALYDYNAQLQNQALLESYNQQLQQYNQDLGQYYQRISGLQGLAGLPSNVNQIAGMQAGIGQTLGQGQMGGYQNQLNQWALQNQLGQQAWQNKMGMAQLGIGALGAIAAFSDRRLKKNIELIDSIDGHNWYAWEWNAVANKMGMYGASEGVLADEVYKYRPDVIGLKDGFMVVNYTKLGVFDGGLANG